MPPKGRYDMRNKALEMQIPYAENFDKISL